MAAASAATNHPLASSRFRPTGNRISLLPRASLGPNRTGSGRAGTDGPSAWFGRIGGAPLHHRNQANLPLASTLPYKVVPALLSNTAESRKLTGRKEAHRQYRSARSIQ